MGWGIIIQAVGTAFSAAGTMDDMVQSRNILSTIEKNQEYLIEISRKIDVTIAQNKQILEKLDNLPEVFGDIVRDVVQVKLLDERYSTLRTARSYFLAFESNEGWDVSEIWVNRLYEALQYLSDHEQRVSKIFQLPYWCDTVLIYTRNSALGFVNIIVQAKIDDLRELEERISRALEKDLLEIESLLKNRKFLRSSNFSRDLDDISKLTFEMQPGRTRTVRWTTRKCERDGACCRYTEICRDIHHSRIEPDAPYNNERARVAARINSLKGSIESNAKFLGDVVSVINQLRTYVSTLDNEIDSPEVRVVVGVSQEELEATSLLNGELPPFLPDRIDCY